MKLRRGSKPKAGRQRQTGSTAGASPAFSYGANRPDKEALQRRESQTTNKAPQPTRFGQFWLRRLGLLLLLLAATASVTSSLTLSPHPEAVPVDAGDDSQAFLQDMSVYQNAASGLIGNSFLNRNKITIDTDALSRQLVSQFPELSDASITLPLLAHRPIVHLQAARPALVLHAGNGSYIIDDKGRALKPSGSVASSVRDALPQVADQSGIDVETGRTVLPGNQVEFIQTVARQLAAKGVKVESMTLPAGTSELDVKIAGQPYFVKFNLQLPDARKQAGTFLATRAMLERKNSVPSQYIDVRVEGRAYYK